jgi:hypothetical protein
VSNGRLDDGSMEGVGYQADDEIVFCDFSIESFVICNIKRDRMSVLDSL